MQQKLRYQPGIDQDNISDSACEKTKRATSNKSYFLQLTDFSAKNHPENNWITACVK
jgi:hypothetical protein